MGLVPLHGLGGALFAGGYLVVTHMWNPAMADRRRENLCLADLGPISSSGLSQKHRRYVPWKAAAIPRWHSAGPARVR
jgi:hypothetical protein